MGGIFKLLFWVQRSSVRPRDLLIVKPAKCGELVLAAVALVR